MPLEGEQLDELLSGYIDDRLTPEEQARVERAAANDRQIASHIEVLRAQRRDLQALAARMAADQPLSSQFTANVMAAINRQPRRFSSAAGRSSERSSARRSRRWMAAGVAAAALAAVVLVALNLPQPTADQPLAHDPSISQPLPGDGVVTPPAGETPTGNGLAGNDALGADRVAGEQVVRSQHFRTAYVLVVDFQITRAALDDRVLDRLLAAAGIAQTPSIAQDSSVRMALEETRMMVDSQPAPADTILYFVHADVRDLDAAMQALWQDTEHFPNVSLDLAIDNPRTRLVEQILKSVTPGTSPQASFATAVANPFPGRADSVQYVSSSNRARGWSGGVPGGGSSPVAKSALLLVGHLVD